MDELAAKVLRENRVDSYGFFVLDERDVIESDYRGQRLSFPAHLILNRSGLKHPDPRTPGARRYRFEPFWLHRLLVDSYNNRITLSSRAKLGI
jgi:hypothetical protein